MRIGSFTKVFVTFCVLVCAVSLPSNARATASDILLPANGTVVRPGVNISLSGTAAGSLVIQNGEDRDYYIQRVDILRNGAVIGSANFTESDDTYDPPRYTWSYTDNISTPGTYSYTSKAYDTRGVAQSTASSTKTVTVASNVPPSVSISPANGSTIAVVPQTITVTASASDSDGSVTQVTLSANGSQLAQCNATTCSANWTASGAGSVTFSATAVDNEGGSSTTQSVVTFTTGNSAQFSSQSIPTTMIVGQTATIHVVMTNSGSSTWTQASQYRMSPVNPGNQGNWGIGRIELPVSSVPPGQSADFAFTITAPTSSGSYNSQWQLLQEGVEFFGAQSPATNVAVNVIADNSLFVSQSVPATMNAGQTYPVSVTMTNTGSATWTDADSYHLGSANPRDNATWGTSRVTLPGSIAPNQSATFSFNVVAPTTTGNANFQWQMVHDGVAWFGPNSTNAVVNVLTGNNASYSSEMIPASVVPGASVPVHVVMTNNGTTTWTQAKLYRLAPVNPNDSSVWGTARVELPVGSVAPGQSADFSFNVVAPSSPGTYNFQWTMLEDGVEVFGVQSPAASVTVGVPTPVNITPPNLSAPLAGSIAAISAVSATGAATYSVPIKVPPGTAGMAPQLSLDYSSQSMDGLLGVGWSISGLSEITRCPRTLAQDAYAGAVRLDTNDRFCLDGQRLILINGTYGADGAEYRTEIDTFTRFVSHTTTTAKGPDSFTVYLKGGEIRNYGTNGTTTESAVAAQGTSPAINLKWAIGRSEDRRGNFLTFTYSQNTSTGEFYPTQISYTGNSAVGQAPYNAVRFVYGPRADSILKYVSGAQVLINQRLTNVQTFVNIDGAGNGGSLAQDYRLSYVTNPNSARDLVSAITECDATGTCLPSTQFSWQQRAANDDAYNTSVWGGPGNGATDQTTLENFVIRGDFNGDGRQDLLSAAAAGTWNVCLSTGTSFDCQTWTGPQIELKKVMFADVNGDGKTDLLFPAQDGSATWTVCIANESNRSFDCATWNAPNGTNGGANINTYLMGDFAGEGRDGFLSANGGFFCRSTGSQAAGFNCASYDNIDYVMPPAPEAGGRIWPVTGDFDGDGRLDFVSVNPVGLVVYTAGDSGFSTIGWSTSLPPRTRRWTSPNGNEVADHNNDGYADYAAITTNDNSQNGTTTPTGSFCRSTGKSLVCRPWSIDSSFFSTWVMGDVDGDGIPDFLQRDLATDNVRVCRQWLDANQNVAVNCSLWAGPSFSLSVGWFYGDFTGRGRVDIALYNAGTGQWSVSTAGGDHVDLLTAVVDGAGARTEFTYKSTGDASAYTKGTSALYPQRDVQPALRVVSEMRRDNGQGGFLTSDYRYAGSRNDVRGRGSLGFGSMDVVDGVTNVTTHSEVSQTFPYTGLTTKLVSTHSSGVELNHQENVLAMSNTSSTSVFFPYVQSSTQATHDLNGASLLQTTMQVPSGGYDAYGNLLSSTTTVSTGSSTNTTTVATAYDNLVSQWLIGLPRQVQITRNLDGSSITRTATMDYDGYGAVAHVSVEPTTPSLAVTTGYTRDAFGNVTLKTLSWTDPATGNARQRNEEQSTFDARGRWPTTVTNALNQSETHVNRDIDGAMTLLTGPNNIATTWTYDGFGRKTQENRADGASTSWAYRQCVDTCNYLATTVVVTQRLSGSTEVAVPSERFLDAVQHPVQTRTWAFDATPIYTQRAYDARGHVQGTTRPFFGGGSPISSGYAYDDLGRLTVRYDLSTTGGTLTSTTSYNGLSVTTQNPNNQTRTVTSNVFGKPSTIVDSGGYTTSYGYDAFGNLTRTTDVKGNQINVAYDRLGRKTQLNDPDLGVSNFSVNPLGQVWQQVDAKNQTTRFAYDDLNRLTHRLEPDLDSYWVYDTAAQGIGKLAEAYTLRGDGTKDYRRVQGYDSLSRPAWSTITLDQDYGTSWTYDGLGRPSTVTYSRNAIGGSGGPAVGFASVYNSYGYLLQTQSTGGSHGTHVEWQAMTQDAEQRVTREQLGDGRFNDRRFNVYTGTLDAVSAGVDNGSNGDDASLENETYLYDALNDMTYRAQRKPDGSLLQESFSYDALNRLISSQVGGQAQQYYGYDEIGNLISKTNVGYYGYPASGAGSVRPHAVSNIGGSVAGQANPAFAYDANGNLTSGANRSMSWTSFDMPATISRTLAASSNTATFVYGPEHQRIRQTVTGSNPITIYYAGAMEKEVTGSGTTVKTRMPRGVGYLSDSTSDAAVRYRYQRGDHLGSSVILTDDTGAVLDRDSYDPWGQRRNADGSDDTTYSVKGFDRTGYTGEEMLDTIGLVHLNGRVYDPLVGRFVSADPTIPDLNESQSLNRFTYVLNNPLNFTDPTGFEPLPGVEVTGTRQLTDICKGACIAGVQNALKAAPVAGKIVRIVVVRVGPTVVRRELATQAAAGAALLVPVAGEPVAVIIEVGGQIYTLAAVAQGVVDVAKDLFSGSLVFSDGADSEVTPLPDYPPQSGGRSGEKAKDAKGPPNSAIPTSGESVWVTDGDGNVKADVRPGRAKDVTPGVGFSGKRDPTPVELDLWGQVKGGKKP